MAKGKSPRKSTPKKNATKNGIVATADDHINVSPSLPNLRLEAKLRAEVSKTIIRIMHKYEVASNEVTSYLLGV